MAVKSRLSKDSRIDIHFRSYRRQRPSERSKRMMFSRYAWDPVAPEEPDYLAIPDDFTPQQTSPARRYGCNVLPKPEKFPVYEGLEPEELLRLDQVRMAWLYSRTRQEAVRKITQYSQVLYEDPILKRYRSRYRKRKAPKNKRMAREFRLFYETIRR